VSRLKQFLIFVAHLLFRNGPLCLICLVTSLMKMLLELGSAVFHSLAIDSLNCSHVVGGR
jgi:hypothetical protein